MKTKTSMKLSACLLAGFLLIFPSCKKNEGEAPRPKQGGRSGGRTAIQFPVEIQTIKTRSLVYSTNAVGSVEAFEKIQVTARVAGVVDRMLFTEGDVAASGQVLVEIDPDRFKLAVEAAQAAYEKALASQADAEAGLKRREIVIKETPGLIPGEELETWRTKVLLAKSDVAQTKASLNQANLNLRDAYVRAPIAGIIQTRTVQTGQYIQVGTVLATLIRRDPLLLRFQVPEREAARMKTGIKALFKVRDNAKEYESRIVHVAAAADESTRMVVITAEIKDTRDEALRPGAFAEITVPVGGDIQAIVIPVGSVRASERGFIVFVVEKDAAVERIITLGMRTADAQVEVLTGLKLGDSLVVRGAEALRNGAPVKVAKEPSKPQEAK